MSQGLAGSPDGLAFAIVNVDMIYCIDIMIYYETILQSIFSRQDLTGNGLSQARSTPQKASVAFFGLLGGSLEGKYIQCKVAVHGCLWLFHQCLAVQRLQCTGKKCIAALFEALGLLLRDLTGDRAGVT